METAPLPRAPYRMRAPRAPSLRTLVRYALKCDSAEQLGKKLRERYRRQDLRRGIETSPDREAEAKLEQLIGQD
jgi:hypothetical protein